MLIASAVLGVLFLIGVGYFIGTWLGRITEYVPVEVEVVNTELDEAFQVSQAQIIEQQDRLDKATEYAHTGGRSAKTYLNLLRKED